MPSDRHRLWRLIEHDFARLMESGPEGYEPTVVVHLAGRDEPLEIGFVRTYDGPHGTLVRFEALNRLEADRADGKAHPRDRWVHVNESFIARVEIEFRVIPETGRRSRFDYDPDPDTDPTSSE